jgi:DNA-binding LacI/PurR family transcriptional regulator
MATLKDVAKLACVDVSTVSRALNNTSYVHPDTKARIFAAVKELSYRPNVLAQGLRQVGCGRFGADMKVALVNDGPVTIVMDSRVLRGKGGDRT